MVWYGMRLDIHGYASVCLGWEKTDGNTTNLDRYQDILRNSESGGGLVVVLDTDTCQQLACSRRCSLVELQLMLHPPALTWPANAHNRGLGCRIGICEVDSATAPASGWILTIHPSAGPAD